MEPDDKAGNAIEGNAGTAREAPGKLTGNRDLEQEGQKDQAKASLKDANRDIGANIRHAANKLKEGFNNK